MQMNWFTIMFARRARMTMETMAARVAVVLVILALQADAFFHDGTNMDLERFDEFVAVKKGVLVKFDVKNPEGERQEAFIAVLKAGISHEDFLILEVTIDDKKKLKRKSIAKYLDTNDGELPVYKLFVNWRRKPVMYEGNKENAVEILEFIQKETGVWLTNPGCLEAFDKLTLDFLQATPRDMPDIIAKTEALAANLTGSEAKSSAKLYINVMKRYVKEGFDFIPAEQNRMFRILDESASKRKKEWLTSYIYILHFFELHHKPDRIRDEL